MDHCNNGWLTIHELCDKYPDPTCVDNGLQLWFRFVHSLVDRDLIHEHAHYHGTRAARKFMEVRVMHYLLRDAKAHRPFQSRILIEHGVEITTLITSARTHVQSI